MHLTTDTGLGVSSGLENSGLQNCGHIASADNIGAQLLGHGSGAFNATSGVIQARPA